MLGSGERRRAQGLRAFLRRPSSSRSTSCGRNDLRGDVLRSATPPRREKRSSAVVAVARRIDNPWLIAGATHQQALLATTWRAGRRRRPAPRRGSRRATSAGSCRALSSRSRRWRRSPSSRRARRRPRVCSVRPRRTERASGSFAGRRNSPPTRPTSCASGQLSARRVREHVGRRRGARCRRRGRRTRRGEGRTQAADARVGEPDTDRGAGRRARRRGSHQPADRRAHVHRARTVKVHLSHIFTKLDVSTRAQLATAVTRRLLERGNQVSGRACWTGRVRRRCPWS